MKRRVASALLAPLALLVAPQVASAGVAGILDGKVTFAAYPGERDYISINVYESVVYGDYVTEISALEGADILPSAGCVAGDWADVDCYTDSPPELYVLLGDGNDQVTLTTRLPLVYTFDGGPGDDELWAGSPGGTGTLIGGDGNDHFWPDTNGIGDELDPPASDDVQGGSGIDTMTYAWHKGVTVSIDDQPGDGAPGESDNIHTDVENLSGSWRDDVLIGSAADNEIFGREGNDVIRGLGGNDRLHGVDGNDTIEGGPGDDYLEGGENDDVLDGGPGSDSFFGDDTSLAVAGNDLIRAIDNVAGEPVSCGLGSDRAEVNRNDAVAADGANLCEQLKLGPPAEVAKIKSKTLRVKRGAVAVKLSCPSRKACRGKLAIKAGKARLAKGKFKVPANKTKGVRAKLTGKGKALLAQRNKVSVKIELRPKGGGKVTKKAVLRG